MVCSLVVVAVLFAQLSHSLGSRQWSLPHMHQSSMKKKLKLEWLYPKVTNEERISRSPPGRITALSSSPYTALARGVRVRPNANVSCIGRAGGHIPTRAARSYVNTMASEHDSKLKEKKASSSSESNTITRP